MNGIFFAAVLIAFTVAGYRQVTWIPSPDQAATQFMPMQALATSMIDAAKGSVTLAIGLIGVMALFLGLMKVGEAGGLLTIIARVVRPLMVRLFPDVPPEHPAMGAMVLNISANLLGLGNAATPFGVRAMQELDTLNPQKGTATNAMAMFLAINTSSVTLLPTGVIALRASAGSLDPAGILPTTLFATICSTTVAIIAVKLYQRFSAFPARDVDGASDSHAANIDLAPDVDLSVEPEAPYPTWVSALCLACVLAFVPLTIVYGRAIAPWLIPGLMVSILGFGVMRKVRVYESFVEGARDGFNVALRIIPYMVAILVAVAMLRESGALALLITPLGAITGPFGLPADALPMALLRPLSGSGAYGILASTIQDPAIGPDSYVGYLVSTFQGSTETTFYVLAVYFGAVQVRRIRHTLAAALTADIAGVIAAVVICLVLFG
ncbi:MAG: spore maturation protein [Rhodospirillaceae bacterium]|jgi:spore maturation protein SpmA|nr:spore maturation protein [Rhodospirillaceae bacterium]MBT5811538.1 spore maturation protein [Rhodospirillaceae bacterium]